MIDNFLASLALSYCLYLSHKRRNFISNARGPLFESILFLFDFNQNYIFSRDFSKVPNLNFNEDACSGSCVVTFRQVEITRLAAVFHNCHPNTAIARNINIPVLFLFMTYTVAHCVCQYLNCLK
jgi:hypothetical protein